MSKKNLDLTALAAFSSGLADLVDQAAESTALVNARKRLPVSGLLIAPNLVLTVDHGVEKEEDIEILTGTGGGSTGKLTGRDPGTDLALITLDQEVGCFHPVLAATARVGMPVVMVGRPDAEGHQASSGIVTSVRSGLRTVKGFILDRYITSDSTPYPGFSGGPLVAFDGGVLGINTSGLVGGVSLAIPLGLAQTVADQLGRFGHVRRGFLGIRSQRVDISQSLRSEDALLGATGLLVVGLEADGPAAEAGLLVGDILANADGQNLADHDALVIFLSRDVAGRDIPMRIIRGGKPVTIAVKIGIR